MAIVEMKRMELLALQKDQRILLRTLQRLACVEVSELDKSQRAFGRSQPARELPRLEEDIQRVQWAIQKISKYDGYKPMLLGAKPEITAAQAEQVRARQPELMRTVEALEALERETGELRGQVARLQALREQLEPWRDFTENVFSLRGTRHTVALLGTVQKTAFEAMQSEGRLPALCCVNQISVQRDLACVYVVAHRSCWEQALNVLKEGNFTQVQLPGVTDTVSAALERQAGELERITEKQQALQEGFAAHASAGNDLRVLCDLLRNDAERLRAEGDFSLSGKTFYLKGWVPAALCEGVQKALLEVTPTLCVEFSTPEEGDEPPVLLHNNALVTPFESVVSGFSLPSPTGIDPTAVMAPFFCCFFGMMVSDAGYGALMALAIPILIKMLKPSKSMTRMMWLLCLGGLATVLWGALYNTWFGFAPWPTVFDPINNSLPVMAVCIGLGAVHLFTALGVGAYMNIKRGKPWDALFDQASWFLLVVGLVMLILPQTAAIGQWLAIAGAGIILVTSGREKSRNPFKRLVSGLGALYGVTSWVSDLLSYMRLFGMGLATGVIGMVINILVGMVFNAGIIGWILGGALFVGGHLFNLGINVLGAYVHSCRLQYIEFFGKFYEEGGKPFKPLTSVNRYVSIKEAAADRA